MTFITIARNAVGCWTNAEWLVCSLMGWPQGDPHCSGIWCLLEPKPPPRSVKSTRSCPLKSQKSLRERLLVNTQAHRCMVSVSALCCCFGMKWQLVKCVHSSTCCLYKNLHLQKNVYLSALKKCRCVFQCLACSCVGGLRLKITNTHNKCSYVSAQTLIWAFWNRNKCFTQH